MDEDGAVECVAQAAVSLGGVGAAAIGQQVAEAEWAATGGGSVDDDDEAMAEDAEHAADDGDLGDDGLGGQVELQHGVAQVGGAAGDEDEAGSDDSVVREAGGGNGSAESMAPLAAGVKSSVERQPSGEGEKKKKKRPTARGKHAKHGSIRQREAAARRGSEATAGVEGPVDLK